MKLTRINPGDLKDKKKEAYNFQKVSGILADFGYQTIKLADDWSGADFIAQHLDGSFLLVQLKGRLTVKDDYRGKELWICFPDCVADRVDWYLCPHDVLLECLTKKKKSIEGTRSWSKDGGYNIGYVTKELSGMLQDYRIPTNA